MDDIRHPILAVATSLVSHVKTSSDDTKYGPKAIKENEFIDLVAEESYEDVLVGDLPAGRYGAIKTQDGIETLVFDTENIPREVLIENADLFKNLHEAADGFAIEERRGIAKAIKEEGGIVDSVYDSYHDKIPSKFRTVLEEALILREADRRRNLTRGTVYDWRGEIADEYKEHGNDPQNAQNLISLCSVGYFDEDNVFDDMYEDLVKNGIKDKQEFVDIMSLYICDNPFAVFVRSTETNADETCVLALDKAKKIDKFPGYPKFIDICGKGSGTYSILEKAKTQLETEHGAEITVRDQTEIQQRVLRIKLSSL
jgi:hypothetical protein